MPASTLSPDTLEVVLERFHEVYDAASFEAVDRLFKADTLLGMLDQGIAFQRSLELIVSQVVPATGIPLTSKRKPELAPPAQSEMALPQLVAAHKN